MMEDVPDLSPAPSPAPSDVDRLLDERGVQPVSIQQWRALDKLEMQKGAGQGRPRVKFTKIEDMLDALGVMNAATVRR